MPYRMSMYACCFCGTGIEERGFDVVRLVLTTTDQAETHRTQNFFCHLDCFAHAANFAPIAVSDPDFLED